MRNGKKFPKIPYSTLVKKVVQNSRANPDQHRQLITSRGLVYHLPMLAIISSTSVTAIVSYPAHRQTERLITLIK